jgi:hypothetical protein
MAWLAPFIDMINHSYTRHFFFISYLGKVVSNGVVGFLYVHDELHNTDTYRHKPHGTHRHADIYHTEHTHRDIHTHRHIPHRTRTHIDIYHTEHTHVDMMNHSFDNHCSTNFFSKI